MRCSDRLWAWPSQPNPITPTPIRRRLAPPEGVRSCVSAALISVLDCKI
jgi:hypothetical protein